MKNKPIYEELEQRIRELEQVESDHKLEQQTFIKERDFISNVLYWIDSLVVVINLEGYIISFNRASEQLSGYRFEEVRDKPFWDILLSPDEREDVKTTIKNVLHKELPKDFRNYWVTKTGEKRLIHWNNSVLRKADGSIEYILCTGLDITERQKAQTALEQNEAKYRELVQNANSIIIRFDTKGNFTFFNEYAQKCFGYTEEEIIGKNVVGTILPESDNFGQNIASLISDIIKNPQLYSNNENENMLRNGQRIWVAWTNKAIYSPKGDVKEILCIGNDITEQKKLENKLQQAQKMESIGTLAGGIAHDFNNLLFPIVAVSEMMMEDYAKDSPEHQRAKQIFKAGMRGSKLVKQILAFSRQSERKLVPVKLQSILRDVIRLSRSTIPSSIKISQDIQRDCPLIMADPTQVHQIAMNLITNAYHAVEESGDEITIQLLETKVDHNNLPIPSLEPGRYTRMSVSDNGHGIHPDLKDKIFDPYFTTKAQGKGTGLGLSVVYGIVKEHGGTIFVESEVGKGATFNIYLPLLVDSDDQTVASPKKEVETGTERILLVDDEEAIVDLEKTILERLGYSVSTRVNSLEALHAFKANPDNFDLVISDMTMPNMTGDRLAKELISIRSNIPIILCTGFSETVNKENAGAFGIKGFLMKPLVISEMAKMVRKVLNDAKESSQ